MLYERACLLGSVCGLIELARIQPVEIVAPAKKMKLQPFQIVPEETVDLPEEILNNYNCSKVPQKVFEEDSESNAKPKVSKGENDSENCEKLLENDEKSEKSAKKLTKKDFSRFEELTEKSELLANAENSAENLKQVALVSNAANSHMGVRPQEKHDFQKDNFNNNNNYKFTS